MIPRFQAARLKAAGNRTNFFVPCRVIPPYLAVDDGLCTEVRAAYADRKPLRGSLPAGLPDRPDDLRVSRAATDMA